MKRKKRKQKFFQKKKQKIRCEKILRMRRHAKKQLKSLLKFAIKYNNPNFRFEYKLRQQFKEYSFITAPQIFSIEKNESEVIEFQHKVKACFVARKKILIRLEKVTFLSTDAILLLLTILVEYKSAGIDFNGTKPFDSTIRARLQKSGFFQYLFGNFESKEEYTFRNVDGQIYTHGQKTVASKLADELIKHSSQRIWGEPRRCPGAQKTLVELMHNTFDHADYQKGTQHWWLSVEWNPELKEVTISFIDYGVGIFRSLDNKNQQDPIYALYQKMRETFPLIKSQHEKLHLILNGSLTLTQSREYYRGKGLSKIYKHYTEGRISSLFILSNFASANVANNDYHSLKKEFKGTFVAFKINSSTNNLPWTI